MFSLRGLGREARGFVIGPGSLHSLPLAPRWFKHTDSSLPFKAVVPPGETSWVPWTRLGKFSCSCVDFHSATGTIVHVPVSFSKPGSSTVGTESYVPNADKREIQRNHWVLRRKPPSLAMFRYVCGSILFPRLLLPALIPLLLHLGNQINWK